jgi:hypothetical protein
MKDNPLNDPDQYSKEYARLADTMVGEEHMDVIVVPVYDMYKLCDQSATASIPLYSRASPFAS